MSRARVRALAAFPLRRGGRLYVLPLVSLKVLGVALFLAAAVVLLLERVVLPGLEDRKLIASVGWWADNERRVRNLLRNGASYDQPLMHFPADPVPQAKTRARRLLVIGDSFVWGDGYANLNDMWWHHLDRELMRRGYDVEVVTAGWGGIQTNTELAWARRLVPELQPDAVLFGYVTNDPDEGVVPQFTAQVDPVFAAVNRMGELGLANLWRVLFVLHEKQVGHALAGPQAGYEYEAWELEILKGDNLKRYIGTVSALGVHCRETHVPCVVVTLPSHPSPEYYGPRYSPIEPIFRAAGIPFYDLLPHFVAGHADLKKEPVLTWGVNPANSHPGPRAQHFYALEVADILEREHAAVLGPKGAPRTYPLDVDDWVPADMSVMKRGVGRLVFLPRKSDLVLEMPIRRPFVEFNLREPAVLERIDVEGGGRREIELFVTHLDKERGYDPGIITRLGKKAGETRSFALDSGGDRAQPVNTILIAGDIFDLEAPLSLSLVPSAR